MKHVYNCAQDSSDYMNLYDNSLFSDLTEGVRPGGLALTEHIIKLCGFTEGDIIADIGCGSGLTLELFNRKYSFDAVGVDLSDVMLNSGIKKFPSLRLVKGDGKNLPFCDDSINGVIAECSLSVMGDTRKILSEIRRVLTDCGKLAITDVYLRHPENAGCFRDLTPGSCLSGAFIYDEIVSMLDDSGFRLLLWEDHSDLWREFVAGLILNNGSLCEILSAGRSNGNKLEFHEHVFLKYKPGYFCLIAEKKS